LLQVVNTAVPWAVLNKSWYIYIALSSICCLFFYLAS